MIVVMVFLMKKLHEGTLRTRGILEELGPNPYCPRCNKKLFNGKQFALFSIDNTWNLKT